MLISCLNYIKLKYILDLLYDIIKDVEFLARILGYISYM